MYKFFTIPIYLLLLASGLFTSQAYAVVDVGTSIGPPISVLTNQSSILTVDLINSSATQANNVAFTDNLPAGLIVQSIQSMSPGCTATPVIVPNTQIVLSGGSIPGAVSGVSGRCIMVFNIKGTTAGNKINTFAIGSVTSSLGSNPTAANATLIVTAPQNLTGTKIFSPTYIHGGGTSTITITLTNPNSIPLTVATFTDNLPSATPGNIIVAPTPAASTTCAGGTVTAVPGSSSFSLAGGTIPGSGSCTVSVKIIPGTPNLGGNIPITNTIPANGVTTNEGSINSNPIFNAAVLTVETGAYVTKGFGSGTVIANGIMTSQVTVTLYNRNIVAITGASITDSLPAGMVVAPTANTSDNCTGGAFTAVPGSNSVTFSGFTLAAAANNSGATSNCWFRYNVVADGTVTGIITNTIPNGNFADTVPTSYIGASANLTATAPSVSVIKALAPANGAPGSVSTLTITLRNTHSSPATITSFQDDLATMGGAPGGFTIAASPAASTTCVGSTLTATSGTKLITLSGGAIPAQAAGSGTGTPGNCIITVPVQIAANTPVAAYTNTIPMNALVTNKGNNGSPATAIFTATAPSVTKVFTPNFEAPGRSVMLTITLTNPAANAANIISFTDDLLARMGAGFTIAATPVATNTCGATLGATPGSTSITITNSGAIPANGSCTLSVPILIAAAKANGAYNNRILANGLQTSEGSNIAASANVPLTVSRPDISAKAFSISPLAQGRVSNMTITLRNYSASNANITSFTDNLTTMDPLGRIVIANTAVATSTCPGHNLSAVPGTTLIQMTAGAIPPRVGAVNGTCTITVPIIPLPTTPVGIKTNTIAIGALQTDAGNNIAVRTANLDIIAAYGTCTKTYAPTSVGIGQFSRMTMTLGNVADAPPFNGLTFTDNLPVDHTVHTDANVINTCGGTVSAVPGSSLVSLTGGTLPAGASSCFVGVNIKAPNVIVAGVENRVTASNFTTSEGYVCAQDAAATLTTTAPTTFVGLNLSFTPSTVNGGGGSILTLLIDNTYPDNMNLTGVDFSNDLAAVQSGMIIASNPNPNVSGGCSLGTVTAVPNTTMIEVRGATIPAGAVCEWHVNITSYMDGNLDSSIPANDVVSTQGVSNNLPALATLTVLRNINVSKFFTPAIAVAGDTSILTINVFNSVEVIRTSAEFVDTLPAGVVVAAGAITNTCTGGTITAPLGGNSIALSGATLAARSLCTITVPVTAAAVGVYTNTIPANTVTTFEGSTNPDPASATLTTVLRPTISKAFATGTINQGGTVVLTFTLSNPNATQVLTNANFSDTLTNMSIATPGAAGGTCTGASNNFFAAGQTGLLSFSGLTIPASGSCTVTVNITSSTVGVHSNTCSGLLSDQTQSIGTGCNPVNLTVLAPPTVSKSFTPSTIAFNGTSTLTFTLANPNPTTVVTLANPTFTDNFPATPGLMKLAAPLSVSTTCVGSTLRNLADSAAPVVGDVGIRLENGSIPANSSCTITALVTADAAGTYNNISSNLVSTNAGTSTTPASASLTVESPVTITISKISNDGVGTFSFSGNNGFTNQNITTITTGVAASATSQILNTAGVVTTISETLAAGHTLTAINCSGLGAGGTATPNLGAGSITLDAAAVASGANILCTFTNSIVNQTLQLQKTWVGAKVGDSVILTKNGIHITFTGDAPNSRADTANETDVEKTPQAVTTGSTITLDEYFISGKPSNYYDIGNYTSTIGCTNNGGPRILDPANPNILTIDAADGILVCTFTNTGAATINGKVFEDNGLGGGTANNGTKQAGEYGLAYATVKMTSCTGTTYDTTTTDAAGNYTLTIPASLQITGGPVCIRETNPSGYISTGADLISLIGTSATYDRTNDYIQFTLAANTPHSDVNFGDVLANSFTPDNLGQGVPGATIIYPHTFVALSGGAVTLQSSKTASPDLNWTTTLYRDQLDADGNCNAAIDATDTLITGAITLLADQQLCILLKQFIPLNAQIGAMNVVTTTATFDYTNANPALSKILKVTDITTTSTGTGGTLTLQKEVDKANAKPGEVLTYTITYSNLGATPISNIVINDMAPGYTTVIDSANDVCCVNPTTSCLGSALTAFPANISQCTGTLYDGDKIKWEVGAAGEQLLPGASGQVKYAVKIQ